MKYVKTYQQINEDKHDPSFIKLITKHKPAVIDFINKLNDLVANTAEFCKNPDESAKEVITALDNLIIGMAQDSGTTPIEMIKTLSIKFNKGLGKAIVTMAAPMMKKFAGNGDIEMSKEIIDTIEKRMKEKYGDSGQAINSMLTQLFFKLGVTPEPICGNNESS